MLGVEVVGALMRLLNAVWLDKWGRWVWLATVIPVLSISGGYLIFFMVTHSFIARMAAFTAPRQPSPPSCWSSSFTSGI